MPTHAPDHEASDTPAWWELTFLAGEHIQRVAIQSLSPSAQQDLSQEVDAAIARHIQQGTSQSHAIGLVPLPTGPRQSLGPAGSLLETIADALGLDEQELDPEEEKDWARLEGLAREVDAHASACAAPAGMKVEFVWDNGGGDDNLFGDGFDFSRDTPEQMASAHGFCNALQAWGEAQGHWYDFWTAIESGPSKDPTANRMTVSEMEQWREDHDEFVGDVLGPLLDRVVHHDRQAKLTQTLPQATASARPPRM